MRTKATRRSSNKRILSHFDIFNHTAVVCIDPVYPVVIPQNKIRVGNFQLKFVKMLYFLPGLSSIPAPRCAEGPALVFLSMVIYHHKIIISYKG